MKSRLTNSKKPIKLYGRWTYRSLRNARNASDCVRLNGNRASLTFQRVGVLTARHVTASRVLVATVRQTVALPVTVEPPLDALAAQTRVVRPTALCIDAQQSIVTLPYQPISHEL